MPDISSRNRARVQIISFLMHYVFSIVFPRIPFFDQLYSLCTLLHSFQLLIVITSITIVMHIYIQTYYPLATEVTERSLEQVGIVFMRFFRGWPRTEYSLGLLGIKQNSWKFLIRNGATNLSAFFLHMVLSSNIYSNLCTESCSYFYNIFSHHLSIVSRRCLYHIRDLFQHSSACVSFCWQTVDKYWSCYQ